MTATTLDLKELCWRAAEPHLFGVTRDQYIAGLEGWDFTTYETDGKITVVFMTKGPEIHFLPTGVRWHMTRAIMREQLLPLIARYGRAITRTPIDDYRQQRFNQIIGFADVGRNEFFIDYKLTKLRGQPCQ